MDVVDTAIELMRRHWIADCWLLKDGGLKQLGHQLTTDQVAASVEQLRILYPKEVCEAGIRNCSLPSGVYELFFPGMCLHLRGLVLLGLDLSVARGWRLDRGLMKRLGHVTTFDQGRAEIKL